MTAFRLPPPGVLVAIRPTPTATMIGLFPTGLVVPDARPSLIPEIRTTTLQPSASLFPLRRPQRCGASTAIPCQTVWSTQTGTKLLSATLRIQHLTELHGCPLIHASICVVMRGATS